MKNLLDNFVSLRIEEIPTQIHRKTIEDQENKKEELPDKVDIKKLY